MKPKSSPKTPTAFVKSSAARIVLFMSLSVRRFIFFQSAMHGCL